MDNQQMMSEKICLVTGATSGIGKVTAIALAKQGATVVLVGRHKEKCEMTVSEIKAQTGNESVEYLVADISSQREVRQLVQDYTRRYSRLHVLVNNAGISLLFKREFSPDGIELTFATNHLGPFLLTNLLLDTLKASAPARIINVASIAHEWIAFDPERIQRLRGIRAYSASKCANILFTYELARRLEGSGVTVNALHPGFVATNIGRNNGVLAKIVIPLSNWFNKAVSPEEGAETSIYLATSPEVEGVSGKYFVKKKATPSAKQMYNEAMAKRLWALSVEMTKSVAMY